MPSYKAQAVKRLAYKGVEKTYEAWSVIVNLSVNSIDHRIRDGWSVEDTLEIPTKCNRKDPSITRTNPLAYFKKPVHTMIRSNQQAAQARRRSNLPSYLSAVHRSPPELIR